jgi:hypothetical protein
MFFNACTVKFSGRRPAALPVPRIATAAAAAGCSGFTVLETAVAGALLIMFLSSLFALNSLAMRLLHSATETASASQDLQTRIEQVRLANWLQITDGATARDRIMKPPTDADIDTGALLPGLVEYLTVAPVDLSTGCVANLTPNTPTPTPPANGFLITRKNGVATLQAGASASTLATGEMVQVNITATWPSWGRQRTRSATSLVSRWGISK